MWLTIQEWWTRLKNWTVASTVGAKREVVETAFNTAQFGDFLQQMEDHILTYHRFPQIVRGNIKPADRPDEALFVPNLPGWLDFQIDEYEGPSGIGWSLLIWVKEGADTWVWAGTRTRHPPVWTDPAWHLEDDLFPPFIE